MSDAKPPLVEPKGEAVNESSIQPGAATQASEASAQGASSESTLRDAMSKMSPAKPEPSAAQRASSAPSEEKTVEKKQEKEPAAEPEKEAPKPSDDEGALEGFRGSLRAGQRKKQKALSAAQKASEQPEDEDVPAEVEMETVKPAAEEEQPVTDAEIEQAINDPKISKRHQKRMQFLANEAKTAKEKLAAAEAKPATDANEAKVKELENAKKEADQELIRYRRRYSLESEPELKKFDEIAVKAEDAINSRLKENGISDATLKLIKDMGGFEGFSRSTKTFQINTADGAQTVTAAQLAKQWLNDMNVADAEHIRAKLAERINASDSKKRRAEELSADAEGWFKGQQEAYEKQVADSQRIAIDYRNSYEKKIDEWVSSQPGLKDKVVPANATADERKEIEDYNKHNSGVKALVKAAVAPTSVEDHVAIVRQAAEALITGRDLKAAQKEIASLKQQLEKVQKGVSTTQKSGGSSLSRGPAKKDDNSAEASFKTTAVDSLAAAMEKLRNGGDE